MDWDKTLIRGAIALVVLAMVVGAGLIALDGFQGSMTADTVAYNTISDFITGLASFADWPTTIVTIIVVTVIIGLIVYFAKKANEA